MTRAKDWLTRRRSSVEVSEEDGVRSLHLGGDAIQSSIRLDRPDELALDYTRAMMAFLLFQPLPREVLMIGLGGGSMARYIHQRMPGTSITVVEINAKVLAVARSMFHFPADDARLKVEIADGADYVCEHAGSADVLLVDGFDDGKQPAALCTQAFYDAAYAALRRGGVMAVNFMAEERKLDVFLQRIEKSFDERVISPQSGRPRQPHRLRVQAPAAGTGLGRTQKARAAVEENPRSAAGGIRQRAEGTQPAYAGEAQAGRGRGRLRPRPTRRAAESAVPGSDCQFLADAPCTSTAGASATSSRSASGGRSRMANCESSSFGFM